MLATETAPTLQPPILLETVAPGRPCAYLAGPMRGYEDLNFPAFHEAAKHLRDVVGWDVVNPAEMDLALGFDPTVESFTFTLDDWFSAMRRDIAVLLEPRVDRIVFLPGWRDSRGANVERIVAEAIGLERWFYIPGSDRGDPTVTMFAT
jgi:hypothetical protein